MKLVGRQASNQDSNAAYRATASMLQANPNLAALWIPEAGSAEGAVTAVLEAKAKVLIIHADVTPTTLEHIKAGNIHMALNPNQGVQGFMGFIATFLAAHPDMFDPFNDYKVSGYNPMQIPFIDNGFAVITKDNANSFDLNEYMEGSRSELSGGPHATSAPPPRRRGCLEPSQSSGVTLCLPSRQTTDLGDHQPDQVVRTHPRAARRRASTCAAAKSTRSPARMARASRR